MPALQNPWLTDSAAVFQSAADAAVASNPGPQAHAGPISESSTATGGSQEAPAAAAKNPVAAGLFPRGFDPERFYADIVEIPAPLFLRDPSPEFRAGEIMPVLKILADYWGERGAG